MPSAAAPFFATLPNALRILALPMPWRQTAALSVFIRTGSLHESRRLSGISHVVEHMAFKGTPTRTCQQINLEAERLGAEVNAYTDRDHTAFHIEGLAADLPTFVPLLADLVLRPSFPEEELERERQVILHELTDVQEDPVAMAFQAFDRACYGPGQAAGRPIIGARANIQRFSRADLLAYVQRQYTASNVVVAVAGPVDGDAFARLVEEAFGQMPAGEPHQLAPAEWVGGLKTQRLAGSSMCQAVLGFEAPRLADAEHLAYVLAAALLGEGMSSPLLDEIRERRGLAYDVACSADVGPMTGQFIIEAATAPAQASEFFAEVARLLQQLAEQGPSAQDLERARRQLRLRALRQLDQPARRLETAAQDVYNLGGLRQPQEWLQALEAVSAEQVQAVFQRFQTAPAAVALAGSVPTRLRDQLRQLFIFPA